MHLATFGEMEFRRGIQCKKGNFVHTVLTEDVDEIAESDVESEREVDKDGDMKTKMNIYFWVQLMQRLTLKAIMMVARGKKK